MSNKKKACFASRPHATSGQLITLLQGRNSGLSSISEDHTAAFIDICGQIETGLPSPGSVTPLGLHCDWTVMRPT